VHYGDMTYEKPYRVQARFDRFWDVVDDRGQVIDTYESSVMAQAWCDYSNNRDPRTEIPTV
jgi:hypothetical protein